MGVKGLWSFIQKNEDSCIEYVDLVERARQKGNIEIIVDYYSFQNYLYFIFLESVSTFYNNFSFYIPGGEYELLHRWIYKLATDLKSLGIHLVFYLDGSKGSSLQHTEAKMTTWKIRHNKSCDTLMKYISICENRYELSILEKNEFIRPTLLEVSIQETLKEAGCEIHMIPFGEADYIIAQQLIMRPRAFAVLSGDSDFVIFRDCVLMPLGYFDIKNDFAMKPPKESKGPWTGIALPEKPIRLIVGVASTERITRALKFSSPDHLIDFSIINGNDFTIPIIRSDARTWRDIFDIPISNPDHRFPSIEDYAKFVRTRIETRIENTDQYKAFCKHNRRFATACEHSRNFYALLLNETEARYKPGQITHHLEKIAPSLLGMHHGFYWHRLMVEDMRYTPIEILLSDLRRYIYQVLAGRGLELKVTEFGRTRNRPLESATIAAVGQRLGLPCTESVEIEAVNRNLRSLSRILLHQERSDYQEDLLRKYGWKNGFTNMYLRYFLTLNWRQNLYIDEEEFMTIVAMTYGVQKLNLEFYYSLPVKPSLRCITIYNWLQDVYRHSYEFLGRLLLIDHQVAKPREVFSSAVFNCFFMIRHVSDTLYLMENHVDRIRKDRFSIIKERKHMIRSLTVGHFEFEDNFW